MSRILTKRQRRMRQGVTVWIVHGFLLDDYRKSGITQYQLTGRPVLRTMGLFVPYKPWSNHVGLSMGDCHVDGPQTYNLHRLFFSRKKAESYLKLLQSGCDVRSMFGSRTHYRSKTKPESWMLQSYYGIKLMPASSIVLINGVC